MLKTPDPVLVRVALLVAGPLLLVFGDCRIASGQAEEHRQPIAQLDVLRQMGRALLAPAAARAPAPPLDPQTRRHVESLLKVELSFVNRVTELNDAERRKLIAASVDWLDAFVVDFARNLEPNQRAMLQQGAQMMVVGPPGTHQDPRDAIRRGVAKVVADTLPEKKVSVYQRECAKRDEFDRDVVLANLIQCVDDKLKLSTEQRATITKWILQNVDSDELPQVEVFMIRPDALPNGVDDWIRPELNDAQRAVLSQVSKLSSGLMFGGSILGPESDAIDDIDLKERPADAESAPPN